MKMLHMINPYCDVLKNYKCIAKINQRLGSLIDYNGSGAGNID